MIVGSFGGGISEEKNTVSMYENIRKNRGKDKKIKWNISEQASKGIKIHKSMSLSSSVYEKNKRIGRVNPEISKHITETSELNFKEMPEVEHHPPSIQRYKG
jgi:hypothetical protein